MIDDVYNAKILGFAGNITRLGRLTDPDATDKAHSKLCVATVIVDLKMQDGVVTDFAHDVKACALGQASSSIMAQNVVGASAQELREVRETMFRMLKENGPPPGAPRWRCGACGETLEPQFTACWRCGAAREASGEFGA